MTTGRLEFVENVSQGTLLIAVAAFAASTGGDVFHLWHLPAVVSPLSMLVLVVATPTLFLAQALRERREENAEPADEDESP